MIKIMALMFTISTFNDKALITDIDTVPLAVCVQAKEALNTLDAVRTKIECVPLKNSKQI